MRARNPVILRRVGPGLYRGLRWMAKRGAAHGLPWHVYYDGRVIAHCISLREAKGVVWEDLVSRLGKAVYNVRSRWVRSLKAGRGRAPDGTFVIRANEAARLFCILDTGYDQLPGPTKASIEGDARAIAYQLGG
jgi:hypothetical protein